MRIPYSLNEAEKEINRRGRSDPNLWADYWLRPSGHEHGWQFDGNFAADGAWQAAVVTAAQNNIIVSGGTGSGKTVGVGAGAMYFACEMHPDFKFLNAAPSSNQASMMHQEILKMAADCPYDKLIWSYRTRPFPQIVIKFFIDKTLVTSTLEFMSIDKNAKNIFSYEGDWVNLEEAGLVDDLEEVLISLGTRLRGTYRGRERLGRLSMISNPWDNTYFWYLFDLAEGDPADYLSMMVSTRDNHNVTPRQLELIMKRLPPEERVRFIDGARPEGRGNFFNKKKIAACEDMLWAETIEEKAAQSVPGYMVQRDSGVGLAYFTTPYQRGHFYMVFGDPGVEGAPHRNAPAICVIDATEFPMQPARIVAFWWGNGNGSIRPFVHRLIKFSSDYDAKMIGTDSTSTQKYMAELINTFARAKTGENFAWAAENDTLSLPKDGKITGMDFSGPKKMAYLRSAAFLIESESLRWPGFLTGLHSQLGNYDYLRDTEKKGSMPQDLVAMLSMASYAIRRYFYADIPSEDEHPAAGMANHPLDRNQRSSNGARARRSSVARPNFARKAH